MKYCRNGRFLNEQTYLNTICKSRCKPKNRRLPDKEKDCCYLECGCSSPFGKLTLRCDKHSAGITIDIDRNGCNGKT
ncbi:MAG: hypothetical protein NC099_03960 [Corallococcus sp.]|nr:hypothetical protein [Bacillota bacterium]MCM1533790.1 hypothetical protein [Corallococcus sp.]